MVVIGIIVNIIVIVDIIGLFLLYAYFANRKIVRTDITLSCSYLPEQFNGYKVAHISDLHNTVFGNDNENLLKVISDSKPDAIFITGDLIDSRRTNIGIAMNFVTSALKIAPVYYVPGNHESRISQYHILRDRMYSLGVIVLDNRKMEVRKNGGSIEILGVEDTSFRLRANNNLSSSEVMDAAIKRLHVDEDKFTILLSHRPELFKVYSRNELDLVFCGHAHGGQIRLPFIGGLYAPQQGIFPKYTAGAYKMGKTVMVVSRGLGNSLFPFRIHNKPEVVAVQLLKTGEK